MEIIYEKAGINDITELTRFRLDYLEEDIGGVKEDERDIIEERLPVYYSEHLNKDFHVYLARKDGSIKNCGDINDFHEAHDHEDVPASEDAHSQEDVYDHEDAHDREADQDNEDGREIVGCCFLLVTEKPANPNFINGLTGTILNVYVKPEYRRQGIAKRMMDNLLNDAKAMGLDYVELKATEQGRLLYKSLGFEDDVSKYYRMKKEL
ncbi:MAG: GNAT family N-acetyltransferase [Lachnospiraceae bacterium]|nr:GNAT family N-acetyltransferase [Lachnospiraceae bacterium]